MSKIDDKQIVFINSAARTSGISSSFEYAVNLRQGAIFDRVTLLSATIPKSYYNIRANNNSFTLIENGNLTKISIGVGNYNRTGLAAYLTNLLTTSSALGWKYSVTFPTIDAGPDNGKYLYTVTDNGGLQPSFQFDGKTAVGEMMGFARNTTNTFVADSLGAAFVSNLQPITSLQIHSNCVNDEIQTGQTTDILQSVAANVGKGPYANVEWICPEFESFSHRLSSPNSGSFTFRITDEDGTDLDLNGVDIQLQVMFWKKNWSLFALSGFIKLASGFIQENRNEKKSGDNINGEKTAQTPNQSLATQVRGGWIKK